VTDDLLPPNAMPLERAISGAGARMLAVDVDAIRVARQPANCAASFLPFLAWERSVHFWNPGDDAGNRARVESAFNDHLNYGSPAALEGEIALDTGLTIAIREFFEAGLAWPYFTVEVVVKPGDPTPDLAGAWASALRRKNTRDMPILKERLDQPPAAVAVAAAVNITQRIVIPPTTPPAPAFVVAATRRVISSISIKPFS